jgi:alginate O-acetyltransferase complex protein AlgI
MELSIRYTLPAAVLLAVPLIRILPGVVGNWAVAAVFFSVLVLHAPGAATIMLGMSLVAWFAGQRELDRWLFAAVILILCFTLVAVKYVAVPFYDGSVVAVGGVTTELNFAVPLGLSFLAFRLLDYVLTARAGRIREHRADGFALYAFFLPIFAAGPIQQFDRFFSNRSTEGFQADAQAALGRVLNGLVKAFGLSMLILALAGYQGAGALIQDLMLRLEIWPAWRVWATLWVLVMHFYLNFAGYCDLAIGSARLLGYRIDENFDAPFLARSPQEFWQRWHITLGDWCRNHVFLPVARLTTSPVLAILATFLVIGLWHAGTLSFVLYGLLNGAAVLLSILVTRKRVFHVLPKGLRAGLGCAMVHLLACVAAAFAISSDGEGVEGAFKILAVAFGFDWALQ